MSLHLEFEPHSWYMGFAIKKRTLEKDVVKDTPINYYLWHAYTDDGNSYNIVTKFDPTLKGLKEQIREYRRQEKERIERLYANTAS